MSLSNRIEDVFAAIAAKTAEVTGSFWSFSVAGLVVLVWALTGPIFGFSDTWQLVINTGTTVVTFLMVFIIQHAQNKDTRAIHLKLNELIAAVEGASNRLIDVEEMTDAELNILYSRYRHLAQTGHKLSWGVKLSIEAEEEQNERK